MSLSSDSRKNLPIPSSRAFATLDPTIYGVDFTSAPTRRKPIVIAVGKMSRGALLVTAIERLLDFSDLEAMLLRDGPWLGGFDLPFGLPRELVEQWCWPIDWRACIERYAACSREELRVEFKRFCHVRAVGDKFAHRATDKPAGSSPSMKWVNPPVAWMLHSGVPRLLAADVTVPGMYRGDPKRVALEAYPGMLARSVTRQSYKSDTRAKQTPERRMQREAIVIALERNECAPCVPTQLPCDVRHALIEDASGDALDAVLCLVVAAWALCHDNDRFGLPEVFDPLEGWIVGA